MVWHPSSAPALTSSPLPTGCAASDGTSGPRAAVANGSLRNTRRFMRRSVAQTAFSTSRVARSENGSPPLSCSAGAGVQIDKVIAATVRPNRDASHSPFTYAGPGQPRTEESVVGGRRRMLCITSRAPLVDFNAIADDAPHCGLEFLVGQGHRQCDRSRGSRSLPGPSCAISGQTQSLPDHDRRRRHRRWARRFEHCARSRTTRVTGDRRRNEFGVRRNRRRIRGRPRATRARSYTRQFPTR